MRITLADLTQNLIGLTARADHPITVMNPEETFVIYEVNIDEMNRVMVRGENTMWFGQSMIEIPKMVEYYFVLHSCPKDGQYLEYVIFHKLQETIVEWSKKGHQITQVSQCSNQTDMFILGQVIHNHLTMKVGEYLHHFMNQPNRRIT